MDSSSLGRVEVIGAEQVTDTQKVVKLMQACWDGKISDHNSIDFQFPFEPVLKSGNYYLRSEDFIRVYETEYPHCWNMERVNDYCVKCTVEGQMTVHAVKLKKNLDTGSVNRADLIKIAHSSIRSSDEKKMGKYKSEVGKRSEIVNDKFKDGNETEEKAVVNDKFKEGYQTEEKCKIFPVQSKEGNETEEKCKMFPINVKVEATEDEVGKNVKRKAAQCGMYNVTDEEWNLIKQRRAKSLYTLK